MRTKLFILFFILISFSCFGQFTQNERKNLKTANNFFDNEQFDKALPIYLELNETIDDYEIKYRIGACFLNTEYDKLKALPFLEEVSNVKNIKIPIAVYFDLGNIYHFMYLFEKSIYHFQTYLKLAKNDEFADAESIKKAKRMIEVCQNAIEITTKPFNAEIEILGADINTHESEFCPMITADDKTMVYMLTAGLPTDPNSITNIVIAHKNDNGLYSNPKIMSIQLPDKLADKPVLLAGLSNDGNTIFLNIGKNNESDIYQGQIKDNTILNIKKLNRNINSNYYEGRVSLSYDGTELYFVSSRPGGFGNADIYKSKINRRGEWGQPENLGNTINTTFNENSPFIHPNNQILYFSSEGHKTIGGNDIFKSKLIKGEWDTPENMGFPNSTKDDLYFVVSADGQKGYFSSSKNNIYDKHNIFKASFKDPIPLTLVKGTIKAGSNLKPITANIKVYDHQTGLPVKYVYNPDPETGKYLMIFPPAKNYDIVIGSSEFLPQLINIHIPYQTYFYELYQEIELKPIIVNNKIIGEKVVVNNMFYDMYKTTQADSIVKDIPTNPQYYDHLLELVENIIQTTDTIRISYPNNTENEKKHTENVNKLLNLIEEAIETTDPVTLRILDANSKQKDKIKQTHFYHNGKKENNLVQQIIGADTLYTAPIIETNPNTNSTIIQNQNQQNTNKKETALIKSSTPEQRNYIHDYVIYYPVDHAEIPFNSYQNLKQIASILIDNPTLGAEIYGFADSSGEKDYNLELSKKRAQNVLKYLIDNKVSAKKIIAKGYGEVITTKYETDKQNQRKVEIHIFEVNQTH